MKKKLIPYLGTIIALLGFVLGCDSRQSVNNDKPDVTFSVDMTVVRDYSQGKDIAVGRFLRDGLPAAEAAITISGRNIPSSGGGNYSSESPALSLLPRANQVTFANHEDAYTQTIVIDLPDSFGVTTVNPRNNQGVVDVQLEWSRPDGASRVALAVVSRDYPADNTAPFIVLLSSAVTNYTVPDTTFEDPSGFAVPGVYYVFLAAFNQGFGEFPGQRFPLPPNLPQRVVSDPVGHMRYGTVAPADSIIILP